MDTAGERQREPCPQRGHERLFNAKDRPEVGSIIWRFTTTPSRRKRDCPTNSRVPELPLYLSLFAKRNALFFLFGHAISLLPLARSPFYRSSKWFDLAQANILLAVFYRSEYAAILLAREITTGSCVIAFEWEWKRTNSFFFFLFFFFYYLIQCPFSISDITGINMYLEFN